MQHNIFGSVKMIDGCKSGQIFPFNASGTAATQEKGGGVGEILQHLQDQLRVNSLRSKSIPNFQPNKDFNSSVDDAIATYGLPEVDDIEPHIDPNLKFINYVESFADIYRRIQSCPEADKSSMYIEQCVIFKGLSDQKLFRRSLRLARQHAIDIHLKIVLSAWLRYERREDELDGISAMHCLGRIMECPKKSLIPGYNLESVNDPCMCNAKSSMEIEECCSISQQQSHGELDEEDLDLSLIIGDDEIRCNRFKIASLSRPFDVMLYGGFLESRRQTINFSQNGISTTGMRAVEAFSRNKSVDPFDPDVVLELLVLANKFCCEEMKLACDKYLASLVLDMESALFFIEYGLEETAHLLVAACLQVFLRELPSSMHGTYVMKYFCSWDARERLSLAGHASFFLYYFLSQIAMEEDMKSNVTVMLLERLGECAAEGWQKLLAFHQLGCVMLERKEYKDAQKWFEAAVEGGHVYSLVGVARAKYKRGYKYKAYKLMNTLISDHTPSGWMYQERSLYCGGKEKKMDLNTATELDPTLTYPYKYRAVSMVKEEEKIGVAISEMNRIIGFKVSPDCLELRAWFLIALQNYDAALRDVRALLTLDPNYIMFHGKLHADHVVELLCYHAQQWNQADCWIHLYDRWSRVDDIGSLAVVHHMLSKNPGMSLLRFRQSLLLLRYAAGLLLLLNFLSSAIMVFYTFFLRLNCQKAAMRSLRMARNKAVSENERLIYEGWILYDTGYREEAIAKAEESIEISRSFEAFFLKAYVLSESNHDPESLSYIIKLLEEALRCPSDGLRKGQVSRSITTLFISVKQRNLFFKLMGILLLLICRH